MAEVRATERTLKLTGEIGWRAGESFSRYCLADSLMWRGEYARALRIARESLAIAEEIEHREWQCGARRVLGVIALDLCSVNTAREHLAAAYEIARRLGSATWIRWTGAPFAIALARGGDTSQATSVLDDVDRLVPSSGSASPDDDRRTLGERYLALARAEIALASNEPARALEWISADDAIGVPRASMVRARAFEQVEAWPDALQMLSLARADAGDQEARSLQWRIEALEGEVQLGQRRRVEARRAFDSARRLATELLTDLEDESTLGAAFRAGIDLLAPPAPEPTVARAAKAAHGGLTQRERETAALIAQGKSNRAIAKALGIGERTVEGYVASALTKLGFNSRAQIAAWISEQPPPDLTVGPRSDRSDPYTN